VGPIGECRVDAGGRQLTVHLAGRARLDFAVDDAVVLEVPPEAVVLLPPEEGA
jgi:hypothetical protein